MTDRLILRQLIREYGSIPTAPSSPKSGSPEESKKEESVFGRFGLLSIPKIIIILLISLVILTIIALGGGEFLLWSMFIYSVETKLSRLMEVLSSKVSQGEKTEALQTFCVEIALEFFLVSSGGSIVKGAGSLAANWTASLNASVKIQRALQIAAKQLPSRIVEMGRNSGTALVDNILYDVSYQSIDDVAQAIAKKLPGGSQDKLFEYLEKRRKTGEKIRIEDEPTMHEINNTFLAMQKIVDEGRETETDIYGVPVGEFGKDTKDEALRELDRRYEEQGAQSP